MLSDKDTQKALRAAEAALEDAIDQKQAMEELHLRDISEILHDIKNPLMAMMGYLSLLKREAHGPIGNPTYKQYIATLERSSQRLLATCNALMDQYDNAGDIPKADPVADVEQLIGELNDLFAAQAKEREIEFHTDVSNHMPKIAVNPHELYRALMNLVSNAIKFTPKGGTVDVEADRDPKDNTFIMVVRDSGIGMTKEQIYRVLNGAHASTVSPHGDIGAGHGLDIVNRIVQSYGGKLEIISTENRGTRIKLKFPKQISLE